MSDREGTKRINISLPPRVLTLAKQIMEIRHFDDLSGFLQTLIREETERRKGPALFSSSPEQPTASQTGTALKRSRGRRKLKHEESQ